MGVDWYSCKSCGETFPDCGDYVSCECGEHWCSDECAEADGYMSHYDEEMEYEDDEYPEEESTCNFCRLEDFDDYELLNFALDLLGMTRRELVEEKREKESI